MRVAIPERAAGAYGPIPARILEAMAVLGIDVFPIAVASRPRSWKFDALLLTGGVDPNPRLYGADEIRGGVKYDDERDTRELAAISHAIRRGLPILGICRGAELLAIHYGGRVTSVPRAHRDLHRGGSASGNRVTVSHNVRLKDDSLLASHLRATLIHGCSSNHSRVPSLSGAQGLRAVGYSSDGVVEVIEASGVVGVMWHPEDTAMTEPIQLDVFRVLQTLAARP